MMSTSFQPATLQLLLLQSRGRRRRMWHRFCQTRRLMLSVVAGVLAVVWLGNAAMTIWLRETASPESLRALLSLGFVLYATWHFARAAFFRPESPFDWTPAERELLASLPLRPRDLVSYQLASITVTTVLKAGLFTLLLLPDVRCVPLAFVGLLLAMMLLEMLRMTVEIATWGMSRIGFLVYRTLIVAGLLMGGFAVGAVVVHSEVVGGQINVGEGLLERFLDILKEVNTSAIAYVALPFQPFVDLILADKISPTSAGQTAAAMGIVAFFAVTFVGLHATTSRRLAERERRNYHPDAAASTTLAGPTRCEPGLSFHAVCRPLQRHIPYWGGAGPLAWRQLVGARRQWGSLLTAMIAPAILASAPCFVIADAYIAFLATAGTLAFYTFLLLPTALRFDFRRDLDRLATFKGMPITPVAIAIGQSFAPVLIATLFQTAILAFAVIARSLPLHYVLTTMLVLVPLNGLVFGLDNLIYLLYPYRVQQEGLEIFLRTMLTFTGKGLLFALGLGAMSAWGLAAAAITRGVSLGTGVAINAYAVFAGGLIVGLSLLAALVLVGLCRTYRKLDPIEDVPR